MTDDSWHAIDLGDAMVAWGRYREIEEAFASLVGERNAAAVFTRQTLGSGLHCSVWAYFSPAAVAAARSLAAAPCAPPDPRSLQLLVGDESALALLENVQE